MAELGPEIPRVEELVGEDEHSHHDGYGRLVAIATVVATLIATVVAFAQASALRTHDRVDARAERYGALALEAASADRGRAQVQIDRLDLLSAQVRTADNASLFQQFGTASTATRLTAARWNAIALQTEADTVTIANTQGVPYICSPSIQPHCPAVNASYSPEQDPRFPSRYIQRSEFAGYRLTALRDAANQQADDAEAQFVHYAAALTMLAVAVFLFGYSLTPQGRARRGLYAKVASSFVAVASVWALFQALSPVSTPPDAAATAFANGEVALNVGNYPAAVADFNRTLRLRPRFVDAYADRAQAKYAAGSPHTGTGAAALPTTAGPATIPSEAALDGAVADDERARDAGSDSATLLSDLGRGLLYRGLLRGSAADLLASRDALTESVTKLKTQDDSAELLAGAYLKLAAGELASGDAAADQTYRKAEAALQATDASRAGAVAGALTDLDLIETVRPRLATSVDAVKRQIVIAGAPVPAGGAPAASSPAVVFGGVSAQPDPGHALYTVDKPGAFKPGRDALSVLWEYKDPLHGEWAVLPELSGPAGRGGLQANGSGLASNNASYVSSSSPATCLPPGHYQVELYVNGKPAGKATENGTWPVLHAVRFSGVQGAMCVPDGWGSFPGTQAGSDGYIAKDQSAGAFILSIPKAAGGPLASYQPGLASLMKSVLEGFTGTGALLPGTKSAGKPETTPFFMSSSNGQLQQWTYQHGVIVTGVGTAPNGNIYIGITWGPADGALAQALFLSLSPL